MNQRTDDEGALRRYLLGQLEEAERTPIEERMLVDDDYFEQLQMAEAELIDEYISGTMPEPDRQAFATHFLAAPERQKMLRLAFAMHRYAKNHPVLSHVAVQPSPAGPFSQAPAAHWFASNRSLKIAASVAIIAGLALLIWQTMIPSDVDRGLSALRDSYSNQRPLQSRITALKYAPFHETRGGEQVDFDQSKYDRARLILLASVEEHPGPQTKHALGEAYLTARMFDRAIELLEAAASSKPDNAVFYNDLGAAYLERAGAVGDKPSLTDLAKSLEALDHAICLNKSLLAAYFNKALCLQRMTSNTS